MVKILTDAQNYMNIADAIRAKNGEEATYKPSEMASAILAIEGGNGRKVSEISIYETTGTFSIVFEDGDMATGSVTFDDDGMPAGLTDDKGNNVTFFLGFPTSVTDKDGNTASIIWG